MGRVVDLKTTRVVLVPLADMTSVSSPKIADINDATSFDITCNLLPSSKIPAYDDDKTTTEMSICEGDEIVAITGSSYSGELVLFHDFTAGVFSATDITTIFTDSSLQWAVVVRTGLPFDTAFAIGQKVDVYPMASGHLQKMRGSGTGYLKGKVKLYALGGAKENVTTVA